MISNFFQRDEFFIDQKINFFKLANRYKVYGNQGEEIGAVAQQLSVGGKMLKLFLNPAMLPFHMEIQDTEENVLSSLSRGWTFWMSKIIVTDAQGTQIGLIEQKFKWMKPEFIIKDTMDNIIGRITGDWMAWNFMIEDAQGSQIGEVNKKWAGSMKEVFTTADKYHVMVNEAVAEDNAKVVLLSAAIAIDMVLKENKR